jgi:hypothetical protein
MICAGLLLAAIPVTAQEPSAQPEPILETGELMLMVIKPAYDELQRAMASPPVDRQQWAQLYQKAARLAEFENLILFRPHERSNTQEWKTLAAGALQRVPSGDEQRSAHHQTVAGRIRINYATHPRDHAGDALGNGRAS